MMSNIDTNVDVDVDVDVDDILVILDKAKTSRMALKQEILTLKSETDIVLVFEGITDFPAYDEWLKHNSSYNDFVHICAKGKKQVIELYTHSMEIDDSEILDCCRFFVDHDYDLFMHNDNNIVTLNCYSIENYIVNECSIKNYLMDEFRLSLSHRAKLTQVINTFNNDFHTFSSICIDICKPLFVNYNSIDKVRFMDRISSYINIEYDNVFLKRESDFDYLVDIESEDFNRLVNIFDTLPDCRAIRGKYVFEFIKKWLSSAKEYLSDYASEHRLSIKNDPETITIRRLAGASPIPSELRSFI